MRYSNLRFKAVSDRQYHHILSLVCAIFLVVGTSANGRAQQCDEDVIAMSSGVNPYKKRDSRCEGEYTRPVASGDTHLAAVYQWFPSFAQDTSSLEVRWAAPSVGEIHLRAESMRPGLHYLMNTNRPSGSISYRWPVNVLNPLRLRAEELGVRAWFRQVVNNTMRDVFLPLRITREGDSGLEGAAECAPITIVIWPTEPAHRVEVSLRPLDTGGGGGASLQENEPLHGAGWWYPAEEPIPVELPLARKEGLYETGVRVFFDSGPTWSRDYLFYRPAIPARCPGA